MEGRPSKLLTNIILDEKNSAIVKLVLNIILLIVAAVAVYGTSGGKPMFMLPFIVYEFLGLMLWAALVTVTVVIMAVYEPGGVDLRSANINIL